MKKVSIISAIFLISLIFMGFILIAMGFRINLTESIPIGLYRITQDEVIKNAYVIFCPDDRKAFKLAGDRNYIDHGLNCNGYGYLMKKVVALTGDVISMTPKGIYVNDELLPYSEPKLKDALDRILPQWRISKYSLQKNEVLTLTNQSEWSFDGRYYGLIQINQIKGIITPIYVKPLKPGMIK